LDPRIKRGWRGVKKALCPGRERMCENVFCENVRTNISWF
jgi:hypothetical protein